MQIKSNKRLLARIRNHEVGVKYPDLIPYIACNIVIQKDNSIFKPNCYRRFSNWFLWIDTKEGYDFWLRVDNTLYTVNTESD